MISISNHEIFHILDIDCKESQKTVNYNTISTLNDIYDDSILFINEISEEMKKKIGAKRNLLVITSSDEEYDFYHKYVSNPRLAMAKVLDYIVSKNSIETRISRTSVIHEDAIIGESVSVEDFVYIGPNVQIGDNSIIKSGAKIIENTVIGRNSIIRENSVIAGQGFGVERDEFGNNFKIPHIGGVIIGNNVEIGALNTVVSGTINPTIIEDFVKTDDHVHIAHNCKIASNTCLTAGVILSGSVFVGESAYIGPNSTVKNSLWIEKKNMIGIGSLVTKNIYSEGGVYAGSPAVPMEKLLRTKKEQKFLREIYMKSREEIEDEH